MSESDAAFHAKIAATRERARQAAAEWEALARALPTLSDAQRAFLRRTEDPVVHWCDWSQQPDIHFACGTYSLPAWGQPVPREALAYIAEDGSAYVFDATDRVTCPACIEARKRTEAP